MNTQTEAERLAGALAVLATWRDDSTGTLEQSAAELRRLSESNAELLTRLKEARELVNDWGECASLEDRERYGLPVDLQMLDAAIAKHSKEQS